MTHFAFRAGLPPLRRPHLYRPARALSRISESTGHHAPARGQSVLPCPILEIVPGLVEVEVVVPRLTPALR